MATPIVYVICDQNCKWEGMTKEQILTAIEQAVSTGKISNVDTGFVQTIKTINGQPLRFFVGTQAEYNALTEEDKYNLYAIITNDTTIKTIKEAIDSLLDGQSTLERSVDELDKNYTALSTATQRQFTDLFSGKSTVANATTAYRLNVNGLPETDLNYITVNGRWCCIDTATAENMVNAPENIPFYLDVFEVDGLGVVQEFTAYSAISPRKYFRTYYEKEDSWGEWVEYVASNNISELMPARVKSIWTNTDIIKTTDSNYAVTTTATALDLSQKVDSLKNRTIYFEVGKYAWDSTLNLYRETATFRTNVCRVRENSLVDTITCKHQINGETFTFVFSKTEIKYSRESDTGFYFLEGIYEEVSR